MTKNHIYPEEHKVQMADRVLNLPEIRCKKCRGLLFKGEYVRIEIKCKKCGYINKL
jgi:hypothetical protein